MYFRRDEKGKNMERLYICSVRECSGSEIKTRKLARERCDGRKACERRAACTTYVFVHADSPSLQCTSDALVSSGRKRRKEKKRSDDVRWRCFCFVQKTKRILREMKIFRDQSRNKREHFQRWKLSKTREKGGKKRIMRLVAKIQLERDRKRMIE